MDSHAGFWLQLSLRVKPEAGEDFADFLQEISGHGVSVEPPVEVLGPDEGYILNPSAPPTLRAYFSETGSKAFRRRIRRRIVAAGLSGALVGRLGWTAVRETDWSEAWKEHYQVQYVEDLAIRPLWLEYEAKPGERVLVLDPGMAFGTGEHETTRLCLEEMQRIDLKDIRVLDLGTGSGVLALAAVALGASEVMAADVEEQAVRAAQSNAELNGMSDQITVLHGSIEEMRAWQPYDCVLANIHATAIIELAGLLKAAVRPGGYVIASGVIDQREDECLQSLLDAGLDVKSPRAKGEWRSFLCRV